MFSSGKDLFYRRVRWQGGDRRRANDGEAIDTFCINISDWPYVYAVVVDPLGCKAWTNPIMLEGKVNK